MDNYTHLCKNKVYRQGTVKRCNQPAFNEHCDRCASALNEQKLKILGLSEAKKKKPSNEPEELEFDEDFEVHDGYEHKKEPNNKQKRKSSLKDGPKGEEGSKKSPYLK